MPSADTRRITSTSTDTSPIAANRAKISGASMKIAATVKLDRIPRTACLKVVSLSSLAGASTSKRLKCLARGVSGKIAITAMTSNKNSATNIEFHASRRRHINTCWPIECRIMRLWSTAPRRRMGCTCRGRITSLWKRSFSYAFPAKAGIQLRRKWRSAARTFLFKKAGPGLRRGRGPLVRFLTSHPCGDC